MANLKELGSDHTNVLINKDLPLKNGQNSVLEAFLGVEK